MQIHEHTCRPTTGFEGLTPVTHARVPSRARGPESKPTRPHAHKPSQRQESETSHRLVHRSLLLLEVADRVGSTLGARTLLVLATLHLLLVLMSAHHALEVLNGHRGHPLPLSRKSVASLAARTMGSRAWPPATRVECRAVLDGLPSSQSHMPSDRESAIFNHDPHAGGAASAFSSRAGFFFGFGLRASMACSISSLVTVLRSSSIWCITLANF